MAASTRTYFRHMRRARYARIRHSKHFTAFLAAQADRLSSEGYQESLFGLMRDDGYSARQVRAASDLGDLGVE